MSAESKHSNQLGLNQSGPNRRGSCGLTPLMRAAAIGHVQAVRELLEEGADINSRGPRGSTALMFAAGGGHLDVVRALVEYGADVSVQEEGGWTARMHVDGEDSEVAKFLDDIEEHLGIRWGHA